MDEFDVCLEPSAGTGSFFRLLPEGTRRGIDVEPMCDGVERVDFFEFEPDGRKRYLVIGNPPFGRVSSLAVKFFNKAAEFADVIAFIVPRTFKRVSVQNRLSADFVLEHTEDLPVSPCCFEPRIAAKCCFQIWRRSPQGRARVHMSLTHGDVAFLRHCPVDEGGAPMPPVGADFAVRAYGGRCGDVVCSGLDALRPKSWHWVKAIRVPVHVLIERFRQLDYSVSKDTVRQDSIGAAELVVLYGSVFGT